MAPRVRTATDVGTAPRECGASLLTDAPADSKEPVRGPDTDGVAR